MIVRSPRFSPEELDRVKAAVTAAEAKTSGEIVPVILPVSQDYSWLPSTVGLRVALITLVFVEILNLFSWPLSWANTFGLIATMTLISMALSLIPPIARKMLGAERLHAGVMDRMRSLFIREGITETKDRTGVLILVSQFEHEISILADRGIHTKLSQKFWDDLCQEFVGAVHENREIDGLCRVIERVGKELAAHFPRLQGDQNELSNELRGSERK